MSDSVRRRVTQPILPWVLGVVAACLVFGPGLRSGDILNLDFVTAPRLRLPDWRWGVGPGVPHRVPLYVPVAWASHVISGATVIKLLYIAVLAALFVGVWRLAASGDRRIDAGIALVVAWSPFTLTRVAVGHLNVLWAMAALAWTAPLLLRPDAAGDRRLRRLSGLTAVGGLIPGSWLLAVGAAGVLAGPRHERRARARRWLGLVPIQLLWIAPSAMFALTGPRLVGARSFRPSIGVLAPLELFAGQGFWRAPNQVLTPPWGLLCAAFLAVVAVLGFATARQALGLPWLVAVGAAVVVPVVAVVPPFSFVVRSLSTVAFGAPLREAQRWWGLALVLLTPALASGVVHLRRRVQSVSLVTVSPAIAAFLLAGNGLWGVGGALSAVRYPAGWAKVSAAISANPGTTLVLPWHQYLDVSFAEGRRVLHPLSDYLPGDLVWSADPELGVAQEQIDPRGEPAVKALDRPESAGAALAALGIRYVAVAAFGEVDGRTSALSSADGVSVVYQDSDITLLRVEATATRSVRWWIGPIGSVPDGDAPIAVAGGVGWMLGGSSLPSDPVVLSPRSGGRVLWFWPGVAVVVADIVGLGWWITSLRRRPQPQARAEPTHSQ
jgi:hypothetical protein